MLRKRNAKIFSRMKNQWNTLVAKIQNIRDDARNGKISDTAAVEKLNGH